MIYSLLAIFSLAFSKTIIGLVFWIIFFLPGVFCFIRSVRSHFINTLKCCSQHGHSTMASCGVDVTAEIFRHAILAHDFELSSYSGNRLISACVATATASEAIGPICEAREGLWDVICTEAPSCRPKGTHDAEVLEVLLQFGRGVGSKFCCGLAGLNGCTACGKTKRALGWLKKTLFLQSFTPRSNQC